MNNMLLGVRDYKAKEDKEYFKSVIYFYVAVDDLIFDPSIAVQVKEGLKYELDNFWKDLPEWWKFYFGYGSRYKDNEAIDHIDKAEEYFIRLAKGKTVWWAKRKFKELIENETVDDLTKTRCLVWATHAIKGFDEDGYYSQLLVERNHRSDEIRWLITGNANFLKDSFKMEYWSWLIVK